MLKTPGAPGSGGARCPRSMRIRAPIEPHGFCSGAPTPTAPPGRRDATHGVFQPVPRPDPPSACTRSGRARRRSNRSRARCARRRSPCSPRCSGPARLPGGEPPPPSRRRSRTRSTGRAPRRSRQPRSVSPGPPELETPRPVAARAADQPLAHGKQRLASCARRTSQPGPSPPRPRDWLGGSPRHPPSDHSPAVAAQQPVVT